MRLQKRSKAETERMEQKGIFLGKRKIPFFYLCRMYGEKETNEMYFLHWPECGIRFPRVGYARKIERRSGLRNGCRIRCQYGWKRPGRSIWGRRSYPGRLQNRKRMRLFPAWKALSGPSLRQEVWNKRFCEKPESKKMSSFTQKKRKTE